MSALLKVPPRRSPVAEHHDRAAELDRREAEIDEREARINANQRRLAALGWRGVFAELVRHLGDDELAERAALWREGCEEVRLMAILGAVGKQATTDEVRALARIWWRECRRLEEKP